MQLWGRRNLGWRNIWESMVHRLYLKPPKYRILCIEKYIDKERTQNQNPDNSNVENEEDSAKETEEIWPDVGRKLALSTETFTQ